MGILGRLASPAGFVLALLCFGLPFLAASCEIPEAGTAEVSYTGVDLATGAEPAVRTSGELVSLTDELHSEVLPQPGVRALAIITAVLAIAGIGTGLLRRARWRLLGGAGAAGLTAVLLVITESVAYSQVSSDLRESAANAQLGLGVAAGNAADLEMIDEIVQTRSGFWLSLALLGLVLLANLGLLLRHRRADPSQ